MLIIRKYRRLGWFDFLDRIELELKAKPDKKMYSALLDEIRMRRLESVSEGGVYKLRAPANEIFQRFEERSADEIGFANESDRAELLQVLNDIL